MGKGTVVTREPVLPEVSQEELEREVRLRIKAGAIRCWVETDTGGDRWLCTEWNVIGEND